MGFVLLKNYVVAGAMLLSSSLSYGEQALQKVIYPDGRVVYEPVPAKVAPAPAKSAEQAAAGGEAQPKPADAPASTKPCNPCGDGTTPVPGGQCKKDNPVELETIPNHPDCTDRKDCKPVHNPQKGELETVRNKPTGFYLCCKDFQGTTAIPVIVIDAREELLFGKQTYGDKCCKYTVCVVTECCCIETKKCANKNKHVNMQACLRHDGDTVDVYVVNEPGFPVRWVLHLGLTKAEYKTKFPNGPDLP